MFVRVTAGILARSQSPQGCARGNARNLRANLSRPKSCKPLFFGKCSQSAQRLLKVLHRDHAKVPCIAPGLAALSPAGTRKTSAPAAGPPALLPHARRSGRPCRRARSRRSRRRGTAVDVAAELLEDLERERRAGRRPADVAEIDVDLDRQIDVASCATRMPMIARFRRPAPRRSVPCAHAAALAANPSATDSPGSTCRPRAGGRPACAPCVQRPRRSRRPPSRATAAGTDGDRLDERTAGLGVDVVACRLERHRRGDLLGARHLGAGRAFRSSKLARAEKACSGTIVAPSGRRTGASRSSQRAFCTVTSTK